MRIRLRGPGGASTITLPDDATVEDLMSKITDWTALSDYDVKIGYPPRPLLLVPTEISQLLCKLDVKLDREQLIITAREASSNTNAHTSATLTPVQAAASSNHSQSQLKSIESVSLQRKTIAGDVPELPLPDRGATMVLRVMPDDNSCLFRAFGTTVVPGDDQSMQELRSLVAGAIQAEPETYTQVVLEKSPDEYCRWIQTPHAWGGAIEMGILSKHFDIEICSIDVQSLRVDRFNEGQAMRCILVYSGIHYDIIVQSPSDPPHLKADNPPEFDQRVWDSDDDEILLKALELCEKLQAKHYYTDTRAMGIKCNVCGIVVHGEGQAAGHAQQFSHYDMAEVLTT